MSDKYLKVKDNGALGLALVRAEAEDVAEDVGINELKGRIETAGIIESGEWIEGRLATNGNTVTTGTALNSIMTRPIPIDDSQSLFVYAPIIPDGADNITVYIARYTGTGTGTFTTWSTMNTFERNYAVFPVGEGTNYIRICIRAKLGNTFDVVDLPLSWHENVYVMYASGAIPNISNIQDYKIRATVADMVADTSLLNGEYVQTLGFDSVGDNGGALYKVQGPTTQNLISVFSLDNGLSASRVFSGDVTLQSLGFPRINMDLINGIIAANGVKNVKCGNLETPYVIKLGDYDFEFDTIDYTGSNYAIVATNYAQHKITGNILNAPSGSGFYADCDEGRVNGNFIAINRINVKYDGITLCPTNHKGIAYNKYFIGSITAGRYGIYVYFLAGADDGGRLYYAWESEELFSVGNIKANSTNFQDISEDGIGVYYRIPANSDGEADYGTISGVTFTNLGVEGSTTGIKMSCGQKANTNTDPQETARRAAGIKSVMINTMRVREPDETDRFLDLSGFIRDIYIKPTSPIKLNQWRINATPTKIGVYVDAPIFTTDPSAPIGYGLRGFRGIRYVDRPVDNYMPVTGDIDYSVINDDPGNAGTLFFSKYYILDSSLSGSEVSMNLMYSYGETARDLLIRVPMAGVAATTVSITFQKETGVELVNTDTVSDHLYSVSCFAKRQSGYDEEYVVLDLGPIGD